MNVAYVSKQLLVLKLLGGQLESWWPLIVKISSIPGYFRAFQYISVDFRMPGTIVCSRGRVKNLTAPRDRSRQKVLHADARFCQVAGFPFVGDSERDTVGRNIDV